MKRVVMLIMLCCLTVGCGKPMNVNGKEYKTCGFINAETCKQPEMKYEVSMGNVIWSVILFETVVAPVYFLGFSLWNPVGIKVVNSK